MEPALASRASRPFPLPGDVIPRDKILVRVALAHVIARVRGGATTPADIAREAWPRDRHVLDWVERGATVPASTTGSGWADALAATSMGSFLASLKPAAGASLIAAGQFFDLSGFVKFNLPRATATGTPKWVAEGAPIPVGQGTIAAAVLGPPCKLALIETVSREIAEHSFEGGEQVVGQVLRDAATAALDGALFSNTAATSSNPAGLLVGITGTTASTSTDGYTACHTDVRTLADAVVGAGGGANILWFCSPGRKISLDSYMPSLAGRTFGSAFIPAGELIAVDANAFASGFTANPEIRASLDGVLHYEDSNPAAIGTPGSPNVVAAPAQSLFQTEVVGLKMILRASWVMRLPAVAYISTGMLW